MTEPALTSIIALLDPLPPAAQWAALEDLQIAGHASLHTPRHGNTWDTQMWSIRLHEISATGYGRTEALRNWLKAAKAVAEESADARDQLAWATHTLQGDCIPMAEAVRAARILFTHIDAPGSRVDITTTAIARATLTAISKSEGIPFDTLASHGLPYGHRARATAA